MVGALSVVGSPAVDSHTGPCLCLDSPPAAMTSLRSGGGGGGGEYFASCKSFPSRWKKLPRRPGSLELGSSFIGSRWHDWRLEAWAISGGASRRQKRLSKGLGSLVLKNELGGQYEDSFEDVKTQMLNYFTYKAVRTVLNQLYEMNPTQYRWFYDFVVSNKPGDGKRFIQVLVKEKQDLAERVMITRLHLYGKWVKKCDHAQIYKEISDENLELMRERLMETVIWPSDDTNSEKIG
ncbi:chaperonin-like RbcX protein 2, chloroplastic [Punica granatum]|uniref:Chaperonin-like RbcX protein 2, chloroplastic n=2 Tax=Punica granatum TaxID=22663 RepID=A0A6P8DAS8_PUNGR|nr:chaperonin-like RbcX protein 2, chloroplastic [Punica granatum]PKI60201.1 hypothetical protein CRG98_019389 [Punica granatum]